MSSFAQKAFSLKPQHLDHPKYRPDIDGLRAIAVWSVVIFHAFPSLLPGGFIGVDVFFVISGYLISTIIYGDLEGKKFRFSVFYSRRINRIFPALLLILATCYAFGWFSLFASEYKELGKHIAGGASFLSNFVLWNESGYFDTTADIKPLLHLWSLGIEEQFYITWPVILWVTWKLRLNLLTITLLGLSTSFFLNVQGLQIDPTATFYLPQARAWELLAGSALAYTTMHRGKKHNAISEKLGTLIKSIARRAGFTDSEAVLRNAQSVLGVTLLAVGGIMISKEAFPGWWALIPCAGAILIIFAGPQAWINKHVLSSKLFVFFGLISFPLYLWHWPLISFARIIESGTPAPEVRLAAVVLAIALGWATYRLIETPLRRVKSSFKPVALTAIMATLGCVGFMTYQENGLAWRQNIKESQLISEQFVSTTGWKYTKNELCLTRYKFEESKKYPWWFCITNKDQNPTVVLLGNSYANHLYPGIVHAYPNESVLSIGACDPAYVGGPANTGDPCALDWPKHQAEFIDSIIKNSRSVKVVIIDGLISFKPKEYTDQQYAENLKQRISYMQDLGIKIVIFAPHIKTNYDIKGCFSRPLKSPEKDCIITAVERKKLFNEFTPLMREIGESFDNVLFFDQNDTFCSNNGCSMIIDGMPAFRDEYYHFTEYASDAVGKNFSVWAKGNGLNLK